MAGALVAAVAAAQQAGDEVFVTLSTGETLKGRLVARSDETVEVDHPALGILKINAAKVAGIVALAAPAPTPPEPPAPAEQELTPGDIQVTPHEPPPPPEPAVKWSGSVETGVNGSEGNTEQFAGRFGANIERRTKANVLTLGADYRMRTENGARTQNELFLRERYEWLFAAPSKWLLFAQADQEYNEFRDYDVRIDFLAGPGYRFIDTERTKLTGRAGVGAAREFGGMRDEWYPIGSASLEFSHRLNKRVALTAYGEVQPDLTNLENYTLVGRAAVEVAMNQSGSLKLKAGVEDRYDNDPGSAQANDLNYFVTLLFSF